MKTLKCATCGATYTAADNVDVYRIEGEIMCELCLEEKEERA